MIKTKVNKHLEVVLNLVQQMVQIADQGVLDDSVDNGFYILYGIIRDNAYEIRNATEKEYNMRKMKLPKRHLAPAR
ncbi:MAG TPA: hypothetical protein VJC37_09570 [Planctomycetota bacterium]|nr:hypothetical protein [Planctomycetota bacterium]